MKATYVKPVIEILDFCTEEIASELEGEFGEGSQIWDLDAAALAEEAE